MALVLSLVATTTIMSLQDRMKEYAVLQTIAIRPFSNMRIVFAESTILCLLGRTLGTISLICSYFTLEALRLEPEGATIAFKPSLGLGALGIMTSLVGGLVAALPPAIQTAHKSIVHAPKSN